MANAATSGTATPRTCAHNHGQPGMSTAAGATREAMLSPSLATTLRPFMHVMGSNKLGNGMTQHIPH